LILDYGFQITRRKPKPGQNLSEIQYLWAEIKIREGSIASKIQWQRPSAMLTNGTFLLYSSVAFRLD